MVLKEKVGDTFSPIIRMVHAFVTLLVEGLKQGRSYKFSVAAANIFGVSLPTLSTAISSGVGVRRRSTLFGP